jgi:hypothetical protein
MAIPTGSASASDMRASMECTIYETGASINQTGYEPAWINDDGKSALLSDVRTAFRKEATEHDSLIWETSQRIDIQVAEQQSEETLELSENCLWDELLWFETRNTVLQIQREMLSEESFSFQDIDENPILPRDRTVKRQQYLQQSVLERTYRNASLLDLPCGSSERNERADVEETLCEFYTVLWIERKDGIAYRRACGWVPKHVWEAYATGPVEVTLG